MVANRLSCLILALALFLPVPGARAAAPAAPVHGLTPAEEMQMMSVALSHPDVLRLMTVAVRQQSLSLVRFGFRYDTPRTATWVLEYWSAHASPGDRTIAVEMTRAAVDSPVTVVGIESAHVAPAVR